ncbi:MAG: hemerythrin family protein [Chromatiaceae bacterium]|nr:hemerythrin family protein [Chromatiaceae bacterium]
MSRILWQESWTLGIDMMDAEHQSLVDGINQLAVRFTADPAQAAEPLGVVGEDTPPDSSANHVALITALEALAEQAREHFKHEEALMRAIDYPELASHRSEHALLLAEYIEMVRDLDRQSLIHLESETAQSLHHWLVGHMVGADKDYADYYFSILGRKQAPPGAVSHHPPRGADRPDGP